MPVGKWREVLCTTSAEDFMRARAVLDAASLPYKDKIQARGLTPPLDGEMRKTLGRTGHAADHASVYYLYTKADDAEEAEMRIKKGRFK